LPPLTKHFISDHGNIMIVDDNPANLKLLEDMLLQRGYQVRAFPLGRLALAAMKNPPDLILLDVNMPEMNGYEVCELLKATPQLSEIPVIFLSALTETDDKVKAFQSGAVDYISKPFQLGEVHARVETQLKLHYLKRALKLQNQHLEGAVAARTHELGAANERLAILDRSKSEFLSLISHELRTPLHGLLAVGSLILEDLPFTEKNIGLQNVFDLSRRKILAILDDALFLTEIDVNGDQFRPVPVSLFAVLSRAIEDTAEFADSRHVALNPPPMGLGFVLGNESPLIRAFQALLETAVKFSIPGETVRLAHETAVGSHLVFIDSCGRMIPNAALAKFFDIFSIGDAITPGGDLGLRPPVASRILSLFGASVSVANRDPAGIRLTISLLDPSASEADSLNAAEGLLPMAHSLN